MNLADGYDEAVRAIADACLPDPELHLDEWSEANVVLPKGSPFPGNYRLSHTPYARRILQALSPGHPTALVVAMVAAQMLKTQAFICAALGWIDGAPGNILALEPSDKLAKRLSGRISKAIAACDAVRDKVAKPRSRDNRNTIDCKEFDGGEMHIVTSGSANNLAEMSARYLFGDEVDRMQVIPNEGHPVDISLPRLTQFRGISKAYLVSTPLVLGFSKIHQLYQQGTRETYHVPCPHCGHLHALERDYFRYEYDAELRRVHRAWFVCPDCGSDIDEHHKATMLPELGYGGQARWVAESQGDGETISVHLPAYYAPLGTITWADLALQLARALEREKIGDPEGMRAFVNTREGLPYDGTDKSTTAEKLMARAEAYPARVIPDQALVVTMFVDVQRTWLELTIEGWGPGLQHWVLDHTRLWGSPSVPPETPGSVWHQLIELRNAPLQHESGVLIPISAFGVDSGDGEHAQDVYNFAYITEHLGCLATKGASSRNRPIIAGTPTKVDVDWKGQRVAEGVKLWQLGTDTAKDHLFNRMLLTDGPGAMRFHQALGLDFFQQLLVERPQVTWRKGRAVREYIKPNGARNEVLDCSVGNLGVAHYLGLHRWAAADWARLRERLIPKQVTPDLFGIPIAPPPAPVPPREPAAAASQPLLEVAPSALESQPPPPPPPAPAQPEPTGRRIFSRGI